MEDVVHRATGEVGRLVADHARERRVDPDQVARGIREQHPDRSVVERTTEEALALLERDLRRPLLADVACEREHTRGLAVPDDRSRAHLNGNAPSGLRRQLRLVDGRRDGSVELAPKPAVCAVRLRGRDEELVVRSDQLAAREAERSLDGGVRVDQQAVGVEDEDHVRGELEQLAVAGVAGGPRKLCAVGVGAVTCEDDDRLDLARRVGLGNAVGLEPVGPIRAFELELEPAGLSVVEDRAERALPDGANVGGEADLFARPADELLGADSCDGRDRRAHVEVAEVTVEADDDVGAVLDQRAEQALLAARRLGDPRGLDGRGHDVRDELHEDRVVFAEAARLARARHEDAERSARTADRNAHTARDPVLEQGRRDLEARLLGRVDEDDCVVDVERVRRLRTLRARGTHPDDVEAGPP